MSKGLLLIVAGAYVVAWTATEWMRRYALKKNLLDIPNARSSHLVATPRGGGIGIVVAFGIALPAIAYYTQSDLKEVGVLLAGGLAVAVVGLLDDRRPLPAPLRFCVHTIAAAFVVLAFGGVPEFALDSWGLHGVWLSIAFAVPALVWVTNLFNFMDGIDGIAAIEAVFISAAGAWLNSQGSGDVALTVAELCLAAASAGFLIWNWPPARIFMGDVGSGFLGFTVAALGLMISQHGFVPIEAWLILAGVFLADATVTLLRRMLRGDRWLESHRMHAYQHLAQRWKSHRLVTLSVTAVNLVWLLPWAVLATRHPTNALGCLAAALTPLVIGVLALGAGSRNH